MATAHGAQARKHRAKNVGELTKPAWLDIREILRRGGFRWCFNDATTTHRRVKMSIEAGKLLEDNLTVMAIEERHGVTVVVEFPPRLTYNPLLSSPNPFPKGEVKLRIYPSPRGEWRD